MALDLKGSGTSTNRLSVNTVCCAAHNCCRRVWVLTWSACSPDLSPAENIRCIIKLKSVKHNPELIHQTTVDNILLQNLQQLLSSDPRCLQTVLNRRRDVSFIWTCCVAAIKFNFFYLNLYLIETFDMFSMFYCELKLIYVINISPSSVFFYISYILKIRVVILAEKAIFFFF